MPAYETFTTRLARHIGLPVVDISWHRLGSHAYALIERYDRLRDAQGKIRRLHQEDFCQALGYGHDRKYQESGGPAFADCFRLVQDASSDPAIDAGNLLRWQIFNWLAGNSDGHAKNLALLYHPDGKIRLAPFYDLVCTRAIERIDPRLAFAIGDERNPGRITPADWAALAGQCGIRPRFVDGLVRDTASPLLEHLGPAREEFETRFGAYPALQRVERVVRQQCRLAVET